ncbi:unnamed protein product [Sphagnum balticum]
MEQIDQLQDTPAAVYDHTSSLEEDVISKVHIMRDPSDPQWGFADLQLHFIELRKNHKPDPQLLGLDVREQLGITQNQGNQIAPNSLGSVCLPWKEDQLPPQKLEDVMDTLFNVLPDNAQYRKDGLVCLPWKEDNLTSHSKIEDVMGILFETLPSNVPGQAENLNCQDGELTVTSPCKLSQEDKESKDACWCTQCITNDLSGLSKSHAVSAEPQYGYLMSDQDLQDQPAHLQKVPSFVCEGEVLGHEVTFEAEDKIMEFNMFIELEDSFQNRLSDVVTALPQGQEVKVHNTCWDQQDYLLENDSKGKGGFEKLSICVGEEELGHELTFETEDDSMKLNMLWDLEDSENWVSEVDCTLTQVNELKTHDTYRNHMLDSGSKLKGHNTCVGQAPTSSSRGKKEQPCSQKGHWFDTSIPGERKHHQKCESAHKSKRMVKYEKDRGYCTGVRSRCNGASFHTSLYWRDAKHVHSDNKRPHSGAIGTYILESVAARVYDCMSLKLHPEKPPLHFPDADYSTDIQEAMNMTIPQYALFLKRKYASLSHGRRNKQCVAPSTPSTLSSEQVGE